jgi:hypothetical protein
MTDAEFLAAFEGCSLTMEQWHHREHIRVAYLYLLRYPFPEALIKMRAGLNALNAAQKVPDLPHRGYHDTMTRAWLQLVHVALCEHGPAENSERFYELNPQLTQNKALRLFYSSDLLMSPKAKAEFVEPDLAPLPKSRKTFTPQSALPSGRREQLPASR